MYAYTSMEVRPTLWPYSLANKGAAYGLVWTEMHLCSFAGQPNISLLAHRLYECGWQWQWLPGNNHPFTWKSLPGALNLYTNRKWTSRAPMFVQKPLWSWAHHHNFECHRFQMPTLIWHPSALFLSIPESYLHSTLGLAHTTQCSIYICGKQQRTKFEWNHKMYFPTGTIILMYSHSSEAFAHTCLAWPSGAFKVGFLISFII